MPKLTVYRGTQAWVSCQRAPTPWELEGMTSFHKPEVTAGRDRLYVTLGRTRLMVAPMI